jgi:GNAT superfamily N-acetyltransferase
MGTDNDTTSTEDAPTTTAAITVRPLEQGDFFAWYELFAGYSDSFGVPVEDERVMRAWAWLHGDESALRGLVAVDETGAVIALAHVQEFERLLENDRGLYMEDLFVSPQHRGEGVATALIHHLTQEARDRGFRVIRWRAAEDNETARRLSDSLAEKTSWLTYDLNLG